MAKKKEVSILKAAFGLNSIVEQVCDELDLNIVDLANTDKTENAISTGILVADLITGGGFAQGMSILAGETGAGKSSISFATIKDALDQGIPVYVLDFEGGTNPQLLESIIGTPLADLFGKKDTKTGKWILEPLITYLQPAVGEVGFRFLNRVLKELPQKVQKDGQWYLKYSKKFKAQIEGKYKFIKKNGKYYVNAEDGTMQALFIIDSLASMVAEDLEEDDEKSPMAVRARMFSNMIPLVTSKLGSKNANLIAINQLREAPMCLHYSSPVLLSDGTTKPVGEIVENKLDVEVVSYNWETKKYENKKVTNWMINGEAETPDKFNCITVASGNAQGRSQLLLTDEHVVFDSIKGYEIKVSELVTGDKIVCKVDGQPNSDARQIMYGSVLGDGFLSERTKGNGATIHSIRIKHGTEQTDYCKFKEIILGRESTGNYDAENQYEISAVTKNDNTISKIHRESYDYSEDKLTRRFSQKLADKINLQGIATWYMDDGQIAPDGFYKLSFSVSKYSDEDVAKLTNMLNSKTSGGFNWTTHQRPCGKSDKLISLTHVVYIQRFLNSIAPYMCRSMEYKFGKFGAPKNAYSYDWKNNLVSKNRMCEVISIEPMKETSTNFKGRNKFLYDIEVEDNHNFIVNNTLVHNSFGNPIYMPGGKSPAYYSSLTMFMRPISPSTAGESGKGNTGTVEDCFDGKGEDIYKYSRLFTEKNRNYAPMKMGLTRIWVSNKGRPKGGFDPVYDVRQYMMMTAQLDKGRKYEIDMPGVWTQKKWSYKEFKELILHKDSKEFFEKHKLKLEDEEAKKKLEKLQKELKKLKKELKTIKKSNEKKRNIVLKKIKKVEKQIAALYADELNLQERCWDQIIDGSAFTLYSDAQVDDGEEEEEEDDDEDEDEEDDF